jgi:sugar phosphate isomerase/epimerase
MIDRLANEYGVNVAIHNHKSPALYWDPKIIMDFIKNSGSTRIGVNADLGHWSRSGLDPLECVKYAEGKIMSVHMKDIDENSHDCIWGEGICKNALVLKELKRQNYKGVFTIEYESKSPTLDQEIENSLSFFAKQVSILF